MFILVYVEDIVSYLLVISSSDDLFYEVILDEIDFMCDFFVFFIKEMLSIYIGVVYYGDMGMVLKRMLVMLIWRYLIGKIFNFDKVGEF